jgi:hypothetical protein
MRLTYPGTFRLGKLHDDLVAAIPALAPTGTGIDSQAVFTLAGTDDGIILEVPDGIVESEVDAVVSAHDPTTPGPAEQAQLTAAANERTIDQRLADQLPVLKSAIDAITASPPTLFAGLNNQERVFLRRMARNQADLIRLVLRELETTD